MFQNAHTTSAPLFSPAGIKTRCTGGVTAGISSFPRCAALPHSGCCFPPSSSSSSSAGLSICSSFCLTGEKVSHFSVTLASSLSPPYLGNTECSSEPLTTWKLMFMYKAAATVWGEPLNQLIIYRFISEALAMEQCQCHILVFWTNRFSWMMHTHMQI